MACEEYEIERHPLSGRRQISDQERQLARSVLTMPSRDFLVRQAILNACAEMFPVSVGAGMMNRVLQDYAEPKGTDWPASSQLFRTMIPMHFRALVESYGGTLCR